MAALVEEEMKWAEERRAAAGICEKLWQCGEKLIFQWLIVNMWLHLRKYEMKWAAPVEEEICLYSGLVWGVHGLFILFGWP